MPLLSARDVAERLGVNEQRVRALAAAGRLPGSKVANRWMFESERLRDVEARARSDGRPFEPRHALALLFLASGEDAPWLSDYDKWRLRRYLKNLRKLVPRLRSRAQPAFMRAPDSLLRRLSHDGHVAASGVSAAQLYGADIFARGVVEIYCAAEYADQIAHRYALRPVAEAAANLVVHRLPDAASVLPRRAMPAAVVACDLLDSFDARTRRAGARLLRQLRRP